MVFYNDRTRYNEKLRVEQNLVEVEEGKRFDIGFCSELLRCVEVAACKKTEMLW